MNRRGWVGGALAGGTLFLGTPLASCSTFGEAGEPAEAGPEAAVDDAGTSTDAPVVEGTPFKCPWTIKNEGTTLTVMAVAEDPPTPLGGAVASGTYTLTECIRYVGAAGTGGPESLNQRAATLLIQSNQYAFIEDRLGGGNPKDERAGKLTLRGTSLEWNEVCSKVWANESFSYSADPNTLVLYRDGNLGTSGVSSGYIVAMVFKKR